MLSIDLHRSFTLSLQVNSDWLCKPPESWQIWAMARVEEAGRLRYAEIC